jgi:hypothetical protein
MMGFLQNTPYIELAQSKIGTAFVNEELVCKSIKKVTSQKKRLR